MMVYSDIINDLVTTDNIEGTFVEARMIGTVENVHSSWREVEEGQAEHVRVLPKMSPCLVTVFFDWGHRHLRSTTAFQLRKGDHLRLFEHSNSNLDHTAFLA
jgi:hypothetical protein